MFCNFLSAVFLFFSFLLLLVPCAVCQPAGSENSLGKAPNQIVLFESDTDFKKNGDPGIETETETYDSFSFPSLFYVKDVLVVFARAANNLGDIKCDIVEGYFGIESDGGLIDKDVENSANPKWNKQITTNDDEKCAESPTFVVDQDKIYVFFKNFTEEDSELEYRFVDGDINNIDGNNGIKWGKISEDIKSELTTEDPTGITSVVSGGPGIVVNETIIIPVMYTKGAKDYFVSLITNVTSDTEKKNWKLILNKPPINGMYPAIVEWEGKLIMMTSSKEGFCKIYESADMGKTWTDSVGFPSALWVNKELQVGERGGRNALIKIEFDSGKKKVMLFTLSVKGANGKYDLHLWMTDYTRVFDVGVIANNVKEGVSSALLYAKENLFAAYEKRDFAKTAINVLLLKDHLATVKDVLKTWTEKDKNLSESCFAADGTITSGDECTDNKIPTDGLVGFLFNNYSNDKWFDEYKCVNAALKSQLATRNQETNGLKFSGAGAGAVWPVGAQGQNQRYHFVNYGFTLLAMVRIDSDATNENKNENSIFGFNFEKEDNKKSIGLWCTKEGEWIVGEDGNSGKQKTGEKCDKNKIYQVALTLNDQEVSVYINGKKTKILPENTIPEKRPLSINHFYFGADSDKPLATSEVTIKNVLLYNRPFAEEEIKKLKPKTIEAGTQAISQGNDDEIPKPDGRTTKAQSHQNTSPTKNDTEEKVQSSSPPPPITTEDSAARVGVVGVLCFMLFGVFTLLGRYVY